jgi:hypothetical protein
MCCTHVTCMSCYMHVACMENVPIPCMLHETCVLHACRYKWNMHMTCAMVNACHYKLLLLHNMASGLVGMHGPNTHIYCIAGNFRWCKISRNFTLALQKNFFVFNLAPSPRQDHTHANRLHVFSTRSKFRGSYFCSTQPIREKRIMQNFPLYVM